MSSRRGKNIFVLACEPSGDMLGALLMAGLKRLWKGVEFSGVGGRSMAELGLDSMFPLDEFSVMGIGEVIPALPRLLRRKQQIINVVSSGSFDALITIDSPDFCLRVGAGVKKSKSTVPVIHYVSPTFWAWRPKRVYHLANCVDHVLTLFPFETGPLRRAGIDCTFVGHPVAYWKRAEMHQIARVLGELKLSDSFPIVLVLPGSRASEVKRHSPTFARCVKELRQSIADVQLVVVMADIVADQILENKEYWPPSTRFLDMRELDQASAGERKIALFSAADAALAASGTVSLELAATATPMVIGYDLNWLSRLTIGRMLNVDTVTLVNLVAESRAVPEFLANEFRAGPMCDALIRLVRDPAARSAQLKAFETTIDRLASCEEDASLRTARAVVKVIG